MLIAAVRDTGYNVLLFLHILAAIVAMAPAFVWPVASVTLKKQGKPVGPAIGELAAGNTLKIHGPALVLTGLFGFGMVGMSNDVWSFGDAWVTAAMLVWFLMIGLLFGLMYPAEKKAHAGDVGAEKIISAVGGGLHLLLFVMLYLMVFKPGA